MWEAPRSPLSRCHCGPWSHSEEHRRWRAGQKQGWGCLLPPRLGNLRKTSPFLWVTGTLVTSVSMTGAQRHRTDSLSYVYK